VLMGEPPTPRLNRVEGRTHRSVEEEAIDHGKKKKKKKKEKIFFRQHRERGEEGDWEKKSFPFLKPFSFPSLENISWLIMRPQ
jgi:hypothetical protein